MRVRGPAANVRVADALRRVNELLEPVDRMLAEQYPGDPAGRQPVHTVCIPADRVDTGTIAEWGDAASALLTEHTAHIAALGDGIDMRALEHVLLTAPVQDLRVDFEDGYRSRGDAAHDADARRVGELLATMGGAAAPSRFGVRPRGLDPAARQRGLRTLELVLDGAGGVPDGFVFTVPKVRSAAQVPAIVALCEIFEQAHGLPERTLTFELQIESPHIVLGADGTAGVTRAVRLSNGRCAALHFGTYDYTAALGIAPRFQSLAHPLADHAKSVMLLAAAQAGVWVSDGATQVFPQGTAGECRTALSHHFDLVTRSLQGGLYQGWDMHPGHLVSRWAATLAFYRDAMPIAASRLDAYCRRESGGTTVDEPATAQTLSALLLRGLSCGAFTEAEFRAHAPSTGVVLLHALASRLPLRHP